MARSISSILLSEVVWMTNSRAKGARGERELANILKDYGYDTRRGQQYSGANGDADVVGLPGIHVECKRAEALNIDKALDQSCRDAKDDEIPVVMHRKDRKSWKVTLHLSDWMEMYKAWEKDRDGEKSETYPF